MRKCFFFLFPALFFFIVSFAQETSEKLSGTVLKKPWTKSTESYCAGGSDYYVLSLDSEEVILENTSNIPAEKYFEKWVGKKVIVIGSKFRKKIKNEDNFSQKPITYSLDGKEKEEDFSCLVFKVKKIQKK